MFGEGLGVADDRRERGAKLMAGVGDEVGAHALDRAKRRTVGQPYQRRAVAKRAHAEMPRAVGRPDADDVDLGLASRQIMSSASGWRIAKRRSRPTMSSPNSARAARLAASVRWSRRSARAPRSRRGWRAARAGIGHRACLERGAPAPPDARGASARLPRRRCARKAPTAMISRIG